MTQVQMRIGETASFRAKDQRAICTGLLTHQSSCRLLTVQQRPRERASPGGCADNAAAIAHRFFERTQHFCSLENIVSTCGPGRCLRIRKTARIDQAQVREAHIGHHSGRRTDIACVRRLYHDNPYAHSLPPGLCIMVCEPHRLSLGYNPHPPDTF